MSLPLPVPNPPVDVERLYQAHAAELYRYLVQLCGNAELAEDAVQETFLRCLRTPPVDHAPRAWLFHVGTNLVREWARTRARRERLLQQGPADATLGELQPGPERVLLERERHDAACAALAMLPERDRVALLMRQAGFTHAEIAEAIGVTRSSISQTLARALEKFARAVGAHPGDF